MSIFVPVRNDFSHPERESCIKIKRHIGRHILGDKTLEMCQRFQLEKELMAAFACFNSQVTVCLGGIRSMSKDWSVRCPTSKFRGLFDTYPHKTDLSNPPPPVTIFLRVMPVCKNMCPLRPNLEGWMARTYTRLNRVTPQDGNSRHKKEKEHYKIKKRSKLQN